jgi:predicted dehydrogenase
VRTPVTVGVVGLGATGQRLARAVDESTRAEVRWLCDAHAKVLLSLRTRHPGARTTAAIEDLLADDSLDALVVTTPVPTRAPIVAEALNADKHVLVRRPLAFDGGRALELMLLAERRERSLIVDEPFVFHPALRKLKELVELGRMGDVYTITATLQALRRGGRLDDVVWTLGADAVAAVLYLLDDEPVEVIAQGETYEQPGGTETASCYLRFATGITATLHLSWLHPQRVSRLSVVGSRRAAVFDEIHPERKLSVYDRTARRAEGIRGDLVCPRISPRDVARLASDALIAGVRRPPDLAGARLSVSTVNVLEAIQAAIDPTDTGTPPHPGGAVVLLAPHASERASRVKRRTRAPS